MATVDELLSKLVNLEIEAVHARQRQAAAEQALTAAQQQIHQLSSGGGTSRSSSVTRVNNTRTLGRPKSFTEQPLE